MKILAYCTQTQDPTFLCIVWSPDFSIDIKNRELSFNKNLITRYKTFARNSGEFESCLIID